MSANAKLDALIARIEGGEALTREMDEEICSLFGRQKDAQGWLYCPSYHESLDSIMSLARNGWEVWQLLTAGLSVLDRLGGVRTGSVRALSDMPPNPKPVLRAMLVVALKERRT